MRKVQLIGELNTRLSFDKKNQIPGIPPFGKAFAVEGMVAEDGQHTVHTLVHALQTHRACRQLRVTSTRIRQ